MLDCDCEVKKKALFLLCCYSSLIRYLEGTGTGPSAGNIYLPYDCESDSKPWGHEEDISVPGPWRKRSDQ